MRRYLILSFIFITTLSFGQNFNKISNPSPCKAAINSQAKTTKTIRSNFEEVVYSSMFNTPQKARGQLLYKASSKIRWEHLSPKRQVILINGSKARFQENGKEVTNPSAKGIVKRIQGLMVQLFSGEFLNEKEFDIAYYQSSTQYKLTLVPKSSRLSRYITSIELLFSKKSTLLEEMTMFESKNDKLVYKFSNTKTNQSISDTKFTQFQ